MQNLKAACELSRDVQVIRRAVANFSIIVAILRLPVVQKRHNTQRVKTWTTLHVAKELPADVIEQRREPELETYDAGPEDEEEVEVGDESDDNDGEGVEAEWRPTGVAGGKKHKLEEGDEPEPAQA